MDFQFLKDDVQSANFQEQSFVFVTSDSFYNYDIPPKSLNLNKYTLSTGPLYSKFTLSLKRDTSSVPPIHFRRDTIARTVILKVMSK